MLIPNELQQHEHHIALSEHCGEGEQIQLESNQVIDQEAFLQNGQVIDQADEEEEEEDGSGIAHIMHNEMQDVDNHKNDRNVNEDNQLLTNNEISDTVDEHFQDEILQPHQHTEKTGADVYHLENSLNNEDQNGNHSDHNLHQSTSTTPSLEEATGSMQTLRNHEQLDLNPPQKSKRGRKRKTSDVTYSDYLNSQQQHPQQLGQLIAPSATPTHIATNPQHLDVLGAPPNTTMNSTTPLLSHAAAAAAAAVGLLNIPVAVPIHANANLNMNPSSSISGRRAVRIAPMGTVPDLNHTNTNNINPINNLNFNNCNHSRQTVKSKRRCVIQELNKSSEHIRQLGTEKALEDMSNEDKSKQKRMLRNRESAARSRDKQKSKNLKMESAIDKLVNQKLSIDKSIVEVSEVLEEMKALLKEYNVDVPS